MNRRDNKTQTVKRILDTASVKKEANRKERLHRIFYTLFLVTFFSILLVVLGNVRVKAQSDDRICEVKAFKYITVSANDSLWSIANEYSDSHYDSIYQYIREVKNINGLKSDTIYAGTRLYIPCYVTNDNVASEVFDICNR